MTSEQKQERFKDILIDAYETSTSDKGITLEEMMKKLEEELCDIVNK